MLTRKLGFLGVASAVVVAVNSVVAGYAHAALSYSELEPFKPGELAVAGAGSATEGITIYTVQSDFESDALSAAKVLKAVEDFEEGNLGPGDIATLAPPLSPGVPNLDTGGSGLGFPTGIDAPNIELSVGDPVNNFLVVLGDGFAGNVSTVVGANTFVDSTVIQVSGNTDPKTAIGMNIFDPIGGTGDYDVTVLDPSGGLLFSGVVSAGAASGSFLGVITDDGDSIGSIEIAALLDGGELLDNIQLWAVPEPSAALLGLLGLLGVMGLRVRP